MAASCLFLAGKVEETPKLSKDIVRTAKNLLSSDQFKGFGLTPVDEMLLYEKILLQVFNFIFWIQFSELLTCTYKYCWYLRIKNQFFSDG